MTMKRKILVTGASGYIASQLIPSFRERYDLTLLDVHSTNRDGAHIDDIIISDLIVDDRDDFREYFKDIDTIVHCGFVRPDDPSDAVQRF